MARRNGGLRTVKAVRHDLAQLRTDVNSLMTRVGRARFGLDSGGQVAQVRRNAARAYGQLSRRAQRYGRSVGRTINTYPMQTAAIAAVAGAVVVGAMLGRLMGRED
ncbi:MAG TPA: hypothetical protein VMQ11_11140 [Alphaproteobacteria bacterium]|nr:hypothetical protein [Alphaproteobacteria bacterium]